MSILRKRGLRPIEVGSFCTIKADAVDEMKNKYSYNKDSKNTRKISLANSKILMVLEENVLDVKGLVRVVPVLMDHAFGYGIFFRLMDRFIDKEKSFIVSSKNLESMSTSWRKPLESTYSPNHSRYLISKVKENYLNKRNIDLEWEDK